MKRSVTVSVYNDNGEVLAVTNRRWGGITLPGGKVEPGEDIEVAAWRELEEETGITPDAMKYLGSSLFDNPFTNDPPWLVSHYEAVGRDCEPSQVEEGTIPSWVTPNILLKSATSIFREHYKKISSIGIICPSERLWSKSEF